MGEVIDAQQRRTTALLETQARKPGTDQNSAADDREKFWLLWTAHQAELRKLSLRLMGGNAADGDDALGTAMLKGSLAYDSRYVRNGRAWCFRLVYNACMDHYRERRRFSERFNGSAAEDIELLMMNSSREYSPEDQILGRERVKGLLDDLAHLPEGLLQPLIMRCLKNMPYDAIADDLNLTNTTVRKRVELARKRLRRDN
jgi:RNA polymerase sigma factor (sigma-70 family)